MRCPMREQLRHHSSAWQTQRLNVSAWASSLSAIIALACYLACRALSRCGRQSELPELLSHCIGMGLIHIRHGTCVLLSERTRASPQLSCVLIAEPRLLRSQLLSDLSFHGALRCFCSRLGRPGLVDLCGRQGGDGSRLLRIRARRRLRGHRRGG